MQISNRNQIQTITKMQQKISIWSFILILRIFICDKKKQIFKICNYVFSQCYFESQSGYSMW